MQQEVNAVMNRRPNALTVARRVVGARLGWRPPVYLVHAVTARCNARCGFCAWKPEFYNPADQLPTDAIKQLYEDAKRAGFVGVSMWGGEPLLHPDFDEILGHASQLGLMTHAVTNGFLLDRKMDVIVRHLDRICISLDHPSSVHDGIRGIKGLFDRIVESTRELRRRAPSKQIIFVYTLQKANVAETALRAMAELMAELGALVVFNGLREDAATTETGINLSDYAPSREQLANAFATVGDLKRKGYPILNSHTYLDMLRVGPPVYRCHWPKFMLPVEANGDVVDCMHWGTRPIGNIRETPFAELLKSKRLREITGKEGERCHDCVSIHRVEISEVWNGNFEPVWSWLKLRKPPRPSAVSAGTSLIAGHAHTPQETQLDRV